MCCPCTGLLVDRVSRYYKGIPEECSREQCSVTQYTVVISNCLYSLSYAFTEYIKLIKVKERIIQLNIWRHEGRHEGIHKHKYKDNSCDSFNTLDGL